MLSSLTIKFFEISRKHSGRKLDIKKIVNQRCLSNVKEWVKLQILGSRMTAG